MTGRVQCKKTWHVNVIDGEGKEAVQIWSSKSRPFESVQPMLN
jgi:hypothetical protein